MSDHTPLLLSTHDKVERPLSIEEIDLRKACKARIQHFVAIQKAKARQRARGFQWMNNSHVVLIPKVSQPESITDYIPISLTHSFVKLFCKVLAVRLSRVISNLVDVNMSAFIKKRCIHDNFKLVHNTMKFLHKNKSGALFSKIDISKAFDTINWQYLLDLMQTFGFRNRWLFWLHSRSSFFVNNQLTDGILHRRGVRQGDPLSPLLFVVAMEPLNKLIRQAEHHRILSPLPSDLTRFKVSLYANDIAMFIKPTVDDVTTMLTLFGVFGQVTGLILNRAKTEFFPIAIDEGSLLQLEAQTGVTVSIFPTKYLGLPLHTKRIPNMQVQLLVDKVVGRLAGWKKRWKKRDLTALTTYWLLAYKPPEWAIKLIDKCRRNFIWKGNSQHAKGVVLGSLVQNVQVLVLHSAISNVKSNEERDKITWNWTSNGEFSVKSVYDPQFVGSIETPVAHEVRHCPGQ
ncbi:hypothetical protein U9M48_023325 [Paspalum notatum var. saurae]|uniref:Reverse transcriptase domain-containing protein n=1 Tax=Paspalum notatum var. saurae TaxID=547442 RepID=A0AAQ3WVV2_PASNO